MRFSPCGRLLATSTRHSSTINIWDAAQATTGEGVCWFVLVVVLFVVCASDCVYVLLKCVSGVTAIAMSGAAVRVRFVVCVVRVFRNLPCCVVLCCVMFISCGVSHFVGLRMVSCC